MFILQTVYTLVKNVISNKNKNYNNIIKHDMSFVHSLLSFVHNFFSFAITF